MRRLKIGNRVIEHWQIIAVFLAIYDFVAICASYFFALLIRFHSVMSQLLKNRLVFA